jgi:diacylglycerol kinase (ATP)
LIVVNPVAGGGRARRVWEAVHSSMVEGLDTAERVVTTAPGDGRKHAREAAEANYERVIAVGGDGTIWEVANGLAGSETVLAIIPGGTGDDCARNLGIPRDPLAAARLALAGQTRAIDLCEIQTAQGTSYYLNVAGCGFDADVAARVPSLPRALGVGGTLPYVLALLRELATLRLPQMRLTLDELVLDQAVFVLAVANGPSYAGGMRVAPDAVVDDGLLDVCVIGKISRLEVLRLVPKLYSGGHRGHPAVSFFRCRQVQAESGLPVHCQADGELVGDLPATFKIHPRGLRCVAPAR